METEVIWTPLASSSLADVLIYLESEWSLRVAQGFVIELELQLSILQAHPEIGIVSFENKLVRRILVTKHNALYYLYENHQLIIVNICDTRSSIYTI